jgi:hypothetical protein
LFCLGIGAVYGSLSSKSSNRLSRRTSIGNISDDTPLDQRIVIPTIPSLPLQIQILNTRFMELNVNQDMMSSLGSYFSFSSSSSRANGSVSESVLSHVNLTKRLVIDFESCFQDDIPH